MDKNYYDILQVNINASPEIIEKAYKRLHKVTFYYTYYDSNFILSMANSFCSKILQ